MNSFSPQFLFATWFGTGLSPKAPGTVGTLATVPVHFLLIQLPFWGHLAFLVMFVVLGTWCAQKVAVEHGSHDPQIVVVDESAGILIALFVMGPTTLWSTVAAIVVFRLLDVTKIWPISAAEKLKPEGVGIMADDVLAGLFAGSIVWMIMAPV